MTYPLRSLLFLPASNARAVEKVRTLPCDAVALDLEDSVGPEHKETARVAAVAAVRAGGFGARTVVIRVNGLDTDWGEADLKAAAACGPDAVLVPKIDGPDDVDTCEARLAAAPPHTRLWAMIETCRAVINLEAIAAPARHTRLSALVIGVNDLSKDMRCANGGDRAPLTYALSKAVTAARAHGLAVLDGVYNTLDDAAGLEVECRQGKLFGFDGKSLIHPNQIEAANCAFAPSPAELAWAQRVVEAFAGPDAQGKGVLRIDGAMVERLHLVQAARLLALAESL
jgi:citrate lyase subunit beta/citryl-CoA lyase